MIYLLLSILCTAMLVLTFKVFERFGIPIFHGIVVNYVAASLCAFVMLPDNSRVMSGEVFHDNWFPLSVFLGSMFIVVFNLTSITTVRYGVSTASVAMKLGLVFPVLLAFTVYGEAYSGLKIAGILSAFVAVVLCSLKSESGPSSKSSFAFLPFVVFVGSGMCDSLTQFANKRYLGNSGIEEFSLFLFIAAGFAGLVIFLYQVVSKGVKLQLRSVVGGIVLGIINYFSFVFLLKSLAFLPWGSSVVFSISNLGTVAVATLAGVILFRETISRVNMLGLIFAALSILLIVIAETL